MVKAGKGVKGRKANVHHGKTRQPEGNIAANESSSEIIPPMLAVRLEFGNRLKKAMADRGVRAIDVANATGIGRDSISGYTRGRVLPEGDRLQKICEFLHTSPEKLVPAYGVDERTAELMPPMSFQGNADGTGWLRINQAVTMEQVSRIMEILRKH